MAVSWIGSNHCNLTSNQRLLANLSRRLYNGHFAGLCFITNQRGPYVFKFQCPPRWELRSRRSSNWRNERERERAVQILQ